MASRKEQKERLKAERVAKEEAERHETARRRRMQIGGAAAAVVVIAAVIVVVALAGGGGGDGETSSNGIALSKDSVPAGAEVGVVDTPPPWQPNYKQMGDRITAMGLPAVGNETFHLHAWLHIYDDGKNETVPANIGIDQATGTISPLHTHDDTGIIHMEADSEFDFTLGQFMAIWGVKFSDNQIGSLKAKGGDQQLQVYLNGQRVNDPVNVVMPEHGNIVIGYGKPGSFPTEPKLDWPAQL